jgi:hypothetical protein
MSASVVSGAARFNERPSFHVYFSLVFVALALGGFARTYRVPVATGTFAGPPRLYLHGILFFGWTVA